jgi:hypothetical protein
MLVEENQTLFAVVFLLPCYHNKVLTILAGLEPAFFHTRPELEFLKGLWGLGTEEE